MTALLRSERLYLRSIELNKDEETLYRWENDSASWRSSGTMNPLSSEFIKQYILLSNTSVVENAGLNLMIALNDGTPIGYVQIHDYNPISRRTSLGIYIDPACRRRGYAREALSLVHAYLHKRLNCQMVYAGVLSDNEASLRLFESLAYTHAGTLSRWQWHDGFFSDLRYYQLCLQ